MALYVGAVEKTSPLVLCSAVAAVVVVIAILVGFGMWIINDPRRSKEFRLSVRAIGDAFGRARGSGSPPSAAA